LRPGFLSFAFCSGTIRGANTNPNSNSYTHSNSYTDTDANADANANSNSYTNSYTDRASCSEQSGGNGGFEWRDRSCLG
jgi:hypothetical protein